MNITYNVTLFINRCLLKINYITELNRSNMSVFFVIYVISHRRSWYKCVTKCFIGAFDIDLPFQPVRTNCITALSEVGSFNFFARNFPQVFLVTVYC